MGAYLDTDELVFYCSECAERSPANVCSWVQATLCRPHVSRTFLLASASDVRMGGLRVAAGREMCAGVRVRAVAQ